MVYAADAQAVKLPWQDVRLPLERRVLALLSNMTTEEKISQLSSNSAAIDHLEIPAFNWWTGQLFCHCTFVIFDGVEKS